ncbi:MAG TPA: TonB-dependent receptor plug domain-containing protein, partial [Opitutaceae bacterium]|nr:TonB-dependent receptor plug domain-containing protein [Opitutaceae bacterium]
MPHRDRCCPFHLRRLLISLLFAVGVSWSAAAEVRKPYNIPAGPAEQSLKTFSTQSGLDVLFATKTVGKVQTNATKGEFTALEALDQVLADTGLVAAQDAKTGALTVTSRPNAPRAAQNTSDRPGNNVKAEGRVMQMGRFEVFGSKVINADIARSRDDVQPYVVMDRAQIEASMATNLEDFLRTRLPMNQSFSSGAQLGSSNFSAINLRGLGSNQTLILVDGRRLPPRPGGLGTSVQGDVNGIPLGMIERVEILPSTASGIYGGGATGGVINIITRKDYSGTEVVMNYLNTFESDSYNRRIEVNGSYQLEGGRTMLTVNASKVDGHELSAKDRTFVQQGRALQLANNPSVFFGTTPPTGYTTNIRSQNGSNLILKNGKALNSPFTHVPIGYAGVATDGGNALVANAGNYNLDLPNTLSGLQSSYLSVPDQEAYGISVRRRFGDHVEIVLDASRFENHGTRPVSVSTDATATIPTTAP